ncbi:MAG TPA: hypothetical protein VF460_05950 [Burkholderiales bacterium]
MSWWLKAVPLILANAPGLVDGARKMLDKRRSAGNGAGTGAEEGSVEHRLALLENRERKMLELIESLATSNQQMIQAIAALRQRARIGLGISVMLFIGLVVALMRAFDA